MEELGFRAIFTLFASLIGILFLLAALCLLGNKRRAPELKGSPYSLEPLILGVDIARSLVVLVEEFVRFEKQPENPPIDFAKAAICRGTGRIFPDCVQENGMIHLDWSFIEKRCPGNYASWGALSEDEQIRIRLLHGGNFEGYQTEESSKRLRPDQAEEYFKMLSPGPLYVDRMKGTLVGWKCVPGTNFEALIVQHPKFQTIDEGL